MFCSERCSRFRGSACRSPPTTTPSCRQENSPAKPWERDRGDAVLLSRLGPSLDDGAAAIREPLATSSYSVNVGVYQVPPLAILLIPCWPWPCWPCALPYRLLLLLPFRISPLSAVFSACCAASFCCRPASFEAPHRSSWHPVCNLPPSERQTGAFASFIGHPGRPAQGGVHGSQIGGSHRLYSRHDRRPRRPRAGAGGTRTQDAAKQQEREQRAQQQQENQRSSRPARRPRRARRRTTAGTTASRPNRPGRQQQQENHKEQRLNARPSAPGRDRQPDTHGAAGGA